MPGPVELALTIQYGGYAIGVAADEARRDFLTAAVREILGDPNAVIDMFIPHFGRTEAETRALIEYLRPAA